MAEIKAVTKVRECFRSQQRPMTLTEIKELIPDLRSNDISMALNYFFRQKNVSREKIPNKIPLKRKTVYQYTYSDEKIQEVSNAS